jgi:hypothetical protein
VELLQAQAEMAKQLVKVLELAQQAVEMQQLEVKEQGLHKLKAAVRIQDKEPDKVSLVLEEFQQPEPVDQ